MLEAVANVSEGARPDVVREIAEAFAGMANVELLDIHSDPSHHRSVLTAVGPGEALVEASCRLAGAALERIDLREHRGVHPRIGALDVLPFVPLAGTAPVEADRLARQVGAQLAGRHGVPVFLYGRVASLEAQSELPYLRRGGFESLAERMTSGELVPDFGPARPHPSGGATAVGAREFLIAYNVNLAGTDAARAGAIARRLRSAGGRLPCVQALGVALANRACVQVPMNLVDFRITSLLTAYQAVCDEALNVGLEVQSSEIVGLIPRAAAFEGMEEALRLEKPPRILEDLMEARGIS